MSLNYKPEDRVKTCAQLERGIAFEPDGLHLCCVSTFMSPLIFTAEEISQGDATVSSITQKKIDIFNYLNQNDCRAGACLRCSAVYETEFKNVRFDLIGGGNINIQHFSLCNLRCKYCSFTEKKNFYPPRYSTGDILKILKEYSENNQISGYSWISANGGEPSLLKEYGEFCSELVKLKIGDISIFSNCVKYDAKFAELLRDDSVYITVSLDAGIPTTFAEVRGAAAMWKVVDTLVRYRKTGTQRMWLKYIITHDNCNEDNLFSFVFLMAALRPDKVYIAPEFPYGNRENPYEFVLFGAKMWYMLNKYCGVKIHIQTDDNIADPKFKKFSDDIRCEYAKLIADRPLDATYVINPSSVMSHEISAIRAAESEKKSKAIDELIRKQINAYKSYMENNKWQKIVDKLQYLISRKNYEYYYIKKSMLFDEAFYRTQLSEDDRISCQNCIMHYCRTGWKQGFNPTSWFDSNRYLYLHPDVNVNPFFHFLHDGVFEERIF